MSASTFPHPAGRPGRRSGSTSPLPEAQPLVVRTAALDLPDDGLTTLVDLLPASGLPLRAAAGADRAGGAPLAWVRRGDGIVGWGEALRVDTRGAERFAAAEAAWQAVLDRAVVRDDVRLPGTGPVAFGSFAFDAESAEGGVLVVPRVVVGRRGGQAWITTISATLDAAPTAALLDPARREPVASPGTVTESDGAVDATGWPGIVADAVARIQAGRLEKVVLARDVVATAEHPLDPRWMLRRLARAYEATWAFSVAGMVGATPELLVRSEKGLVASRVLAGTIRREPGMTDDDALLRAAHLARSSKDLEEHEHAVVSVARALEPFCTSMNVPEQPFVLHLPNVMHLASDVTGVLDRAAGTSGGTPGGPPSSLTLAAALHPSAAVCGTPTAPARELIRELEGMDRGRYAGPVGWMGGDGDGEWGIALRSARLDDADPHRVRLFAGCGVVAASDPAAELAESEAKLVPMRWALGS
ncbi:isochorismate synthase [Xylanimonas allomyrinae]|uniref:isochorismate synthase n=1 Tax=Xylanimonas allomyrinae TaxID=2509459 RepID=A0A4P6ENQ2_9MICO|nr:isochorismate synthase [Xylanimonas allomyrinae]QAY64342.1 isochorismate synthase [Xylanimonas allomyrinae]